MAPSCRIEYIQVKSPCAVSEKAHRVYMHQLQVDPYAGCSYNCQYCWVSKESKIDYSDKGFVCQVGVKTDLLYNLKKLVDEQTEPLSVLIGGETDPYQQQEEQHKLTRMLMEILLKKGWPLVISTKSDLVLRDLDIIREYNKKGSLAVVISFSTLDDERANLFEGFTTVPKRRVSLIERLSLNGITVGAALCPIMPYISDDEKSLKNFFSRMKYCGAEFVIPGMLRLERNEQAEYVARFIKYAKKINEKLPVLYEDLYKGGVYPNAEYRENLFAILKELSKKYGLRLHIHPEEPVTSDMLNISYE